MKMIRRERKSTFAVGVLATGRRIPPDSQISRWILDSISGSRICYHSFFYKNHVFSAQAGCS